MTKAQLEKEAKKLDLQAERLRKGGRVQEALRLRDVAGALWHAASDNTPAEAIRGG